MANVLPEITNYDPTVYQIQFNDPVSGYNSANPNTAANQGIANQAALNLANRTNWLYTNLNAVINGTLIPTGLAPLLSPSFTGTPTTPTPALGDNSLKIANTAFVQGTISGELTLSVAGGSNVSLSAVQAGNGIMNFTGALTANIAVIVPNSNAKWVIINSTNGAFTLTVKTAAGAGVAVTQGAIQNVFCNGAGVYVAQNDFPSIALTGVSTSTTPAQFDASTKIATTAFVQRMGMQSSGFSTVSASQTLGAGVIGGTVQVSGSTAAIALTMPLTSAVEYGSRIEFVNASNFAATIQPQGASDHVYNINAGLGPIVLQPADCVTLECQSANIWIAVGGSNQLPLSSAMNGANWTTPLQFDSSAKLATTAFVQRALGNFQSSQQVNANATLVAANSGNVYQITGAYTVTLPAISTMQPGAAFVFSNNTSAVATIVTAGSDLFAPGSANSISFATDNLWVAAVGGVWLMLSGSAALPYASAMAGANWTTPPAGDNTKKLATTAFVQRAIGGFSGFVAYNASTTLTNAQANYAIQSYGGTITFTLPVGSTMPQGSTITFYNDGAGVLSIATQGSDFIYAGSNVQPVTMNIGDTLELMSRGGVEWDIVGGSAALQYVSGLRVATPAKFDSSTRIANTAWVNASGPVVGSVRNLKMVVAAGATSATLTADEIIVETALGGAPYRVANVNQTINLATTGAGGMDTGTATANGFLGIYEITGPAVTPMLYGTMEGSVALPSVYGGATGLPAGYVASSLVAVVPISATAGQFYAFAVEDRIVYIPRSAAISTNTISNVWTSAATGVVPKSAREMLGDISASGTNAAANADITIGVDANGTGIGRIWPTFYIVGQTYYRIPLVTAQTFFWFTQVSGTSTTISFQVNVSGYTF